MSRLSLTTTLAAILVAVAWLATPAMSQTDVVVKPTSYDFGGVPSGSVTVTIRNDGFSLYEVKIEWQKGSSGNFTSAPATPYWTVLSGLLGNPQLDVKITYTSSGPGVSTATLLVSVSDLIGQLLQVVKVELSGGVEAEPEDPKDLEINIDIKPGGNPNSINLKSKGVVPVAVLTDGNFDASAINPETVTFAGAKPVRWKMTDVDDDGDQDMLFHFNTQDLLDLDENSTEATLTGQTGDGQPIHGTDTVKIVPGSSRPSRAPGKHNGVASTWGKIKAK